MNIRFKSIEIENFRSIEKAKVILEQQGTVIVVGVNEYEDKASSNGSGKSSIFEAIVYALFEETSGGEKDVANRINNCGFNLCLEFEIDSIPYIIYRKNDGKKTEVRLLQNNKEISARNKTDTNKQIIKLLGITKDIFLDSVFLSQEANTNLSKLQPTARKERLEILTNTDNVVNSFKEKLKDQQAKYEAQCINFEKDRNLITGKIQVITNQQAQYKIKIQEIEKQIQARNEIGNIEEIEQSIKNLQTNIENYKNDLVNQDTKINEQQQLLDNLQNDNLQLFNEQTSLIEQRNENNNKLINIDTDYKYKLQQLNFNKADYEDNINKENNEIKKIKESDTCPTCGRKYENINEEHINQVVNEHLEKIKVYQLWLDNDYNKLKTDLENEKIEKEQTINKDLQKINNKLDELNKNLEEFNSKQTILNDRKNKLLQEKQEIQNTINEYESQLKQQQNLKDRIQNIQIGNKQEFEDLLQESDKSLQELQNTLKKLNEEYTQADNYVGTIKHCQQLVTKDFRTYLLKNSIDYLNNLLEQYSKELFSNEKDKIFITNDDNKLDIMLGDATFESLSGGEKTRVNIALLLAQKSLANTIGNITCNIIVLDEVLGYCDNAAEENVINLITKELSTLESIYMISHKQIQIGYDSELLVTKDIRGLSNISVR